MNQPEVLPPAAECPIVEYRQTDAAIATLRDKYEKVQFDVATAKGMDAALIARRELRELRTKLEGTRETLKKPVIETGRLIDAEAKRITRALLDLEEPIDEQIKAEETRRLAEKKAREEAERAAMEREQNALTAIGQVPVSMIGKGSAEVRRALQDMMARDLTEFTKLSESAKIARERTIGSLEFLLQGAVAQEEAVARAAAEERERQAAEAREREENERRNREEAERLAAERAKLDAERRAEDAARRKREEEEAAARRVREEEERQIREANRAEEERQAAERKALREREEQVAAREAALANARTILTTFRERFGREAEFKDVVAAIDKYLKGRQ